MFKFNVGDIVKPKGDYVTFTFKVVTRSEHWSYGYSRYRNSYICYMCGPGREIYSRPRYYREEELEAISEVIKYKPFMFDEGDIVKYSHYVTGEERLYEVVSRHRGKVHNQYVLRGHKRLYGSNTFTKVEGALKLHSKFRRIPTRSSTYKLSDVKAWFEKASAAINKAGGSVSVETLESMDLKEFASICELNHIKLVYSNNDYADICEVNLYSDLNNMEKAIIHFE